MSNNSDAMHLIAYTSKFTGNPDDITAVLAEITNISKSKNPTREITGLLFYHNNDFLQVIEGSKESLNQLMTTLAADSRHKEIVRLVDEPIKFRSFSDWNMDAFNLSRSESLDHDELENITRAFKQCMEIRSSLLVRFYKAMLATHMLKKL